MPIDAIKDIFSSCMDGNQCYGTEEGSICNLQSLPLIGGGEATRTILQSIRVGKNHDSHYGHPIVELPVRIRPILSPSPVYMYATKLQLPA